MRRTRSSPGGFTTAKSKECRRARVGCGAGRASHRRAHRTRPGNRKKMSNRARRGREAVTRIVRVFHVNPALTLAQIAIHTGERIRSAQLERHRTSHCRRRALRRRNRRVRADIKAAQRLDRPFPCTRQSWHSSIRPTGADGVRKSPAAGPVVGDGHAHQEIASGRRDRRSRRRLTTASSYRSAVSRADTGSRHHAASTLHVCYWSFPMAIVFGRSRVRGRGLAASLSKRPGARDHRRPPSSVRRPHPRAGRWADFTDSAVPGERAARTVGDSRRQLRRRRIAGSRGGA